jgi:Zn-dependent M28 family amino/carboxypeptidase
MNLASSAAAAGRRPFVVPAGESDVIDGMRADRMIEQVTQLGGPRVAGTPDAKRAAEQIRDLAAANGWDAHVERVDPRQGGGVELWNVVAEHKGTNPDGERRLVLAGAHLDSVRGAYGANDDASGAAALLEATKVFSQVPTKHDLRFVWFDGEEKGLLGSRAYVTEHRDELKDAAGMIVAEMLGSPAGRSYVVFSDRGMTGAARPVTEAAARHGMAAEVVVDPMAGSDHMPFARIGVPSLVIASAVPRTIGREDPNYHRPSDTPDKLNPNVYESAGDLFGLAVNAYANA